jgi:hypothetical protein
MRELSASCPDASPSMIDTKARKPNAHETTGERRLAAGQSRRLDVHRRGVVDQPVREEPFG